MSKIKLVVILFLSVLIIGLFLYYNFKKTFVIANPYKVISQDFIGDKVDDLLIRKL